MRPLERGSAESTGVPAGSNDATRVRAAAARGSFVGAAVAELLAPSQADDTRSALQVVQGLQRAAAALELQRRGSARSHGSN